MSLPDSLKTHTRALHTELERSATMHALLRGQIMWDRAFGALFERHLAI